MSMRHMVRAEWLKLWTVRTTTWTPVALIAMVVGLAALVGLTQSLQPDDTILGGSLSAGGTLGLMVAAAFGALVTSTEHGTGMIAATLAACPRRARLLASKAVVTAGVLGGAGFVASALGLLVGRWLLAGAGYASGEPIPALVGIAATFSVAGLLGLAAGSFIRHPAGAVGTVLSMILAPILVGPLLGDLQRWVAGASPSGVLQKLAQSSDAVPATVGTLGAWPSLGVMTAYAALALLLAALALEHRDA